MNEITTKTCTKCKETKDSSLFNKRNSGSERLRSGCKKCEKEYLAQNKEALIKRGKEYRERNKDEIKERKKAYYQKNKDSITIRFKKYYQDNLEAINQKKKEYSSKNKDSRREYDKKYYEENKKAINDRHNEYHKEYYKENKEAIKKRHKEYFKTGIGMAIIKNSQHRRRTITKQGDVTTGQMILLQQDAKVCYWCNKSLKRAKTHIDHYVPISKGGEHTLSNLVVSCQKCNSTKHAKDPIAFANSIGKLL